MEYDNSTDNNTNYRIVSDLVIQTSKDKNIDCPLGYEVINSGCDLEGCDLNYFAGGNYIYICQKKQDISVFENETNSVNKIQIINSSQECDDKLKKININLNEDAGGDVMFLCYGNDEISLNPIVDFFIYIKDVNKPPKDYICDSINLNKGTTKGKPTYLCYKRINTFSFPLLYEDNEENSKDDLTIVSDIYVVNDENSKDIDCGQGYDIVNSGCANTGCDLNYGAGGDFIYLCQRKEKINKLSGTTSPINEIQILHSSTENTNLKKINVDLNRGAGGEDTFIAFGYDREKPLSPIVDFFVYIIGVNNVPEDYECDNSDLNKGTGASHEIYLCYKRNDEIPREIIINSIELYYDNAT